MNERVKNLMKRAMLEHEDAEVLQSIGKEFPHTEMVDMYGSYGYQHDTPTP